MSLSFEKSDISSYIQERRIREAKQNILQSEIVYMSEVLGQISPHVKSDILNSYAKLLTSAVSKQILPSQYEHYFNYDELFLRSVNLETSAVSYVNRVHSGDMYMQVSSYFSKSRSVEDETVVIREFVVTKEDCQILRFGFIYEYNFSNGFGNILVIPQVYIV
jgi:hypothetical protein